MSTIAHGLLDELEGPLAIDISLLCRRVPGVSLQNLLADGAYSLEQKFDAIGWSLKSLGELHQCVADWGDGIHQSISHGDATANNVIVDFNNWTAYWIDFDTRHRPEIPEVERRADDLRTLIYSAAASLPQSSFPKLADVLAAARIDLTTIACFQHRLAHESDYLTVAQLAQAPLGWSAASALRAALQQASLMPLPSLRRLYRL